MTRARDVATQGGLVLLNTTSFSGASSVIVDNVFNSTYDNYKVMVYLNATSATLPDIYWYGRSGSPVADTTTNYVRNIIYQSSSTVGGNQTLLPTFLYSASSYPNLAVASMDIFTPNLAKRTMFISDAHYVNSSGAPEQHRFAGYQDTNVQFTGIKILPSSGTFGGVFNIYGYKKN